MLRNGKAIRFLDKQTLLKFINVHEHRQMIPHYSQVLYSGSYKYEIITVNGDNVLVLYKDIKMITTKYIRLLGNPISASGNLNNEREVLNSLSKQSNVTQIYLNENEMIYPLDLGMENKGLCDIDFYSNIQVRSKEIEKSKWRSKYRINQYKDKLDFRKATIGDYEQILKLHNVWKEQKENSKNGLFSKTLFKGIFRRYNELVNNGSIYVMEYNSYVLGFVVLDDINNGMKHMLAQQYYTKHNAPQEINNSEMEHMLQHIGQIFYYHLIKELDSQGYNILTVAGDIPINGTLAKFKEQMHKSKLLYNKYYFIK